MKKENHVSEANRSFRRLVRKFFASWLKRQNCSRLTETQTIIEMLEEIENSIEIIAREIRRREKRGKS